MSGNYDDPVTLTDRNSIVAATMKQANIEFVADAAAAKLVENGGIGAYLYYSMA